MKRGQFNVLLTTYDYVIKEKALLGKVDFISYSLSIRLNVYRFDGST